MRFSGKTEYALAVYVLFFVAVNITGSSFFTDIGWAPYIESTSNSNPPSGATWIENKGLHWADGNNEYYMDYRLLRGEYNLDTGSGSTAYDNSEYSNDGTINGATWVSGKHGSALNFDGTDDSVNLGSPSSLQVSSDLTICMWLNPDNLGAQRENPIDKAYGAEFSFTFEDDNDHSPGTLSTYFGSSGGNSGPYATNRWTDVATDGTWSHICWVRDIGAKEVTLYKNGQNWNSYQTVNEWENPVTSTHDLLIGNGYVNSFDGQIDELIILNRAISQQKVKNIYNGAGSKTGGNPGNAWIEGNSIHWIDSNGVERSYVAPDTGSNVGNSGNIWMEDGFIHFIDSGGNERSIAGWEDSFEDQDIAEYSGNTGGYGISSSNYDGSYSLSVTTDQSFIYRSNAGTIPQGRNMELTAWIYDPADSNNDHNGFYLDDDRTSRFPLEFQVDPTNELKLWDGENGHGPLLGTTSGWGNEDTWYRLRWYYNPSSGYTEIEAYDTSGSQVYSDSGYVDKGLRKWGLFGWSSGWYYDKLRVNYGS